ncbi:MAG: M28 family peptidase [Proteobacteria bacterium]|nr:M28 family peptidase [Pseudomonadota bacterium]
MRPMTLLLTLLAVAAPALAAPSFDGRSWWHTVQVLADDRYEGRETGSRGERGAQDYLVGRLKALHVRPAGTHGYFQPVELRSRELDEAASSVALVRGGDALPLVIGDDLVLSTRVELAPDVDAPLVFVGYGLRVPELNHDDYAGLDLKGKIAVVFQGSPAAMPSALAAHYQSQAERWKTLRAVGAIGILMIPNPAAMDIPWSRIALNRSHPSMVLADPAFDETAGGRFGGTFNPAQADKLFAGTGHDFAELAKAGAERGPLPTFALPLALRAHTRLVTRAVHSRNVVAVVPGRDRALAREYVVLTAHLDHLGVGQPINGDRINNGAMDNASGSALLLDLARTLDSSSQRPRRSVLFVWVTAEEKGLLGSRYFANHPTVPGPQLVANINTDMFLPIVPLKVATVYGLAESDLGDLAAAAAARLGIRVQADPEPLRNLFIRSDQYNFIKQGVPSLAMRVGFDAGTPEEKLFKDWLTARYHAPSDDTLQPVDLAAAGAFEELTRQLTLDVANAPVRPRWKPDSFFRRYAPAP